MPDKVLSLMFTSMVIAPSLFARALCIRRDRCAVASGNSAPHAPRSIVQAHPVAAVTSAAALPGGSRA